MVLGTQAGARPRARPVMLIAGHDRDQPRLSCLLWNSPARL